MVRRYEVQDLRVIEYLPQMVVLSETYWQVWQLQSAGTNSSQYVR